MSEVRVLKIRRVTSRRTFWLLWCVSAFTQVALGWATLYETADQCLKVGWVLLVLYAYEEIAGRP
jgi:hypothetical protein